jgi:hypothetical protein
MAVLRQAFDVPSVILLGGIKICVLEGMAIVVTPRVHKLRIFPAPAFQPAFLFVVWSPSVSVSRHDRWLKMVSKGEDEMNRTRGHTPRESLPGIARQPACSVR